MGVEANFQNSTEFAIIGAQCRVDIEKSDGTPIDSVPAITTSEGKLHAGFDISDDVFEGGTSLIMEIACHCSPGGKECYYSGTDLTATNIDANAEKSFLINDLAKFLILDKWVNNTGDFQGDDLLTANTYPAVYLLNEFGAKVLMKDNPIHLGQGNISWTEFNQTTVVNLTQNGQAFATAGKAVSLCFQINNSFADEVDIFLRELTFDDDTLEQSFFPLDLQTKQTIRGNVNLLHTGVKSTSEDGILEKCTEQFYIPDNIVGANDFDANFEIVVEEEGFTQHLDVESDEFYIYGKRQNTTFVPLVHITNITTNKQGQTVNACTDLDVIFTYDFYGEEESRFFAEYCIEQTDNDILEGCAIKEISVDTGINKTINQTFQIPYFKHTGNAEITVGIFETKEAIQKNLKGFADFEPSNELIVTANQSASCLYARSLNDRDQRVQFLQLEAFQGIEEKTGTFKFEVDAPLEATIGQGMDYKIFAQIEEQQIVSKEVNFTCFIKSQGIEYNPINFNQMVNRSLLTIFKTILVPTNIETGVSHVLQCEAEYDNLGSRTDSFFDSFTAKLPDSGGTFGATFISGEAEAAEVDTSQDAIEEEPEGIIETIQQAIQDIIEEVVEEAKKSPLTTIVVILVGGFIISFIYSRFFADEK